MTHTQEELVKRLRAFSLAHGGEPAIDKIADDLERLACHPAIEAEELVKRLLPCPFCGGEAKWSTWRDNRYIMCANDECFGPHTTAIGDDAIVQWNKRTAPTQWPEEEEIAGIIRANLLHLLDVKNARVTQNEVITRTARAILALRGPSQEAERLAAIKAIIEGVDNRCMAADGPVTPTLQEMRQDEISRIYMLAGSKLCEDCPPVGYPTDKTRCEPCPRRLANPVPLTGQEQAGARSSMDDEVEQRIQQQIDAAPEPLRRLGERLADLLQADDWNNIEPMLLALALPAGAVAVPDGWKLVPVEPTDEMLESALTNSGDRVAPYEAPDAHDFNEQIKAQFADLYRWLLSAAPQPPKETGE